MSSIALTAVHTGAGGYWFGNGNQSFATVRGGDATNKTYDSDTQYAEYLDSNDGTAHFDAHARGISEFDLTAVPAGVTVTAATLTLYGTSRNVFGSQYVVIDLATAFANNLANFNLANFAGVEQASNRIALSAWALSDGANVFTLNATCIANIQAKLSGSIYLATRVSGDFDNVAPSWSGDNAAYAVHNGVGHSDATVHPKLTLTYTVPVSLEGIERTPIRGAGRGIMRP